MNYRFLSIRSNILKNFALLNPRSLDYSVLRLWETKSTFCHSLPKIELSEIGSSANTLS